MEQQRNTASRRREKRSAPQPRDILSAGVLAAVLAGFLLLSILTPDREFSEAENRKLAQTPEFSMSALTDGSYLADLGSALADQFPGRDLWISVDLWLDRFFGQQESGGVYLCEDDYLMQAPGEPDQAALDRNIRAINDFAIRHSNLKITMTVVPNAVTVHADKLPANAPVRDQLADLEDLRSRITGAKFSDVTAALQQHSDEYLFYRTDHHWTSLAACYAFTAMAPDLGISAPATDSYTVYPVSTTFEGTLSSRSGSHAALDQVDIYVPATQIDYSVTYVESQQSIASMYSRAALEQKDHYTVFFGGNHARVDITTTAQTGRNLLVLKDSYANCFIQFLYPHYDRIIMVDPRYYYSSLENLVSTQGITDVLYLYNLDTFLGDTSLADVLES